MFKPFDKEVIGKQWENHKAHYREGWILIDQIEGKDGEIYRIYTRELVDNDQEYLIE